MRHEYFFVLVGLVWIFGWVAVWLARRVAVEGRAAQARELAHRERMAAIEKGVPLPEIPADEEVTPPWLRPEAERIRAAWLRRLSLAGGLVCLLTGLGICAAFYWAPDRGFFQMWTIGFIPAMAGVGLLLYAALARATAESDQMKGQR